MKSLIIDFSNVNYRCIFAAERNVRDKIGNLDDFDVDRTTLYKFYKKFVFSEIMGMVERFSPNRVVIALDSKNFWRKDIYPEYKAQRQQQRDDSTVDFDEFFPIANAYLEELKTILSSFYFIQVDRAEADDLIAVLARKFEKNGEDVVISSTDTDLDQLCSARISRYNPLKREMVKIENPKLELSLKIIYGDKVSDNIPNILLLNPSKFPVDRKIGVGPVLAEKILKEEGFIESAMVIEKVRSKYKNLSTDTIKEEVRKNYERNVQLIDLSKIPLEYEVKIVSEFDNYPVTPINFTELNRFAMRINAIDFLDRFFMVQGILNGLNKETDDFVS